MWAGCSPSSASRAAIHRIADLGALVTLTRARSAAEPNRRGELFGDGVDLAPSPGGTLGVAPTLGLPELFGELRDTLPTDRPSLLSLSRMT